MKLHNNYPLAPDEIEIEREMLPNYQIKIADFYHIVKNGVRKNFLVFDQKVKVLFSKFYE